MAVPAHTSRIRSTDLHSVDQEVPDAALERYAGPVDASLYIRRDSSNEEAMDVQWEIVG